MSVAAELWERGAAIAGGAIVRGGSDHAGSPSRVGTDRYPAAIVRCTSVEQVVLGVGVARRAGLRVRVGCEGHHDRAMPALGGGPLVVDLCRMRDVAVDPHGRTARVGAGASIADLDLAAVVHGLGEPQMVGAEVVTADGLVRRVGPGADPDLFRALSRGGAGLGVVTRIDLALRPCRRRRRLHAGTAVLNAVVRPEGVVGPDHERREMIRRAYDPDGLFAPR